MSSQSKLSERISLWLSSIPRLRHTRALWMMVVFVLLGFALRIYQLDAKDMWVDEAHPWHFASLPIFESVGLGFSGGPINSGADPTYNILLHYWISLTGNTLFGLRYFSVLVSLVGVAYLGRVAARAFGWRAGRAALFVGTIAPVWIYFAQEVRPYFLTPVLMLVMVEAVIRLSQSDGSKPWPWIMLAVGEALSIYTHGFMVVAVFGINLWIGVLWLRRLREPGKWLWLRSWVISQFGAILVLSPVLWLDLARAGGIRNPFTVPLTLAEFANMMWAFCMGIPWEDVLAPLPLRLWLALLLVLAGLGLAVSLRREGNRRHLADLAWLLLGLSALMFLYDQRDPSFNPRYAEFITGPLFLVLGVVVSKAWGQAPYGRWLSVGLVATLVIVAATSLDANYAGRFHGYRHPATLAVSEALKTGFGPEDGVVIVAPHDFTINYYGHGDAPLVFSRLDEGIEQPADLLSFVAGKRRIGLLRNNNEQSDSRRLLPFHLERYGALVRRQYFEGYDLSVYRLDDGAKPALADFKPVSFNFGDLQLVGMSAESADAVTVALQWRARPDLRLDKRYAASIRLTDPVTNWDLGGADMLMYSDRGLPTDWWEPGLTTTQYFVIPLQPGTPPIDVDISVTVYDKVTGKLLDLRDAAGAPAGQQAHLGAIRLGPAPENWAYGEDQRPWRLNPVDSDLIPGYLADQPTVAPGAALGVTLAWLASPDEITQARVVLERDGVVLAEAAGPPLDGRSPAQVAPGKSWLDRRLLHVSKEASSGPAELAVLINERRISLGSVEISGVARLMTPPEVENPLEAIFGGSVKLIGYRLDLPDPLTSDSPIPLTLYWQALADGAPEANYKVFTQVLSADGRLVGQHDGVPVGETRPFSGWLSGEYVIDEHVMIFNEPYQGLIHIQVGLYDPVTFQRVLTADGKDSILLPVELQVESKR